MALETWNGRTAGQTDADSPLDTTLLDGLRKDLDHLRQVLYGSTDPNFHTPAWGHNHDGVNSKIVPLANQTPGDYCLTSWMSNTDVNGQANYVKAKEIKLGVGGTIRIYFTLTNTAVSGWLYGKIYKNGVAVGIERSVNANTTTTFSEDIGGWSPGDLLQVYGKTTTIGAGIVFVGALSLYTAAPPIGGGHISY